MSKLNVLEEVLYPLTDELEEDLGVEIVNAPDTRLYGQNAPVDSLALVSFVVAVEERVAELTGRDVVLADEKAMSRRNSPFATLASFAEYIEVRLGE